jgi:ribosomal protein L22
MWLGAIRKTQRTLDLAREWVRDTMSSMKSSGRLPNIGQGYTADQRAEAAIKSIAERKLKSALTAPQRVFWRSVEDVLIEVADARISRTATRADEIERGLREGKYAGKAGAFFDKVIQKAVDDQLRREGLLPSD